MSKSRKKPIRKDKGFEKSIYWRKIRRIIKRAIKLGKEVLPHPKEIINDYNYCDWIFDYRFRDDTDKWKIKFKRK